MAHKPRTLDDLLHHRLKQLREAERHAAKLLGRMAKAAGGVGLVAALQAREIAIHAHAGSIDHLFGLLDRKPHDASCAVMDGLVAETRAVIEDYDDSPALDGALLAAAEAIDHDLLARYGALRRWTGTLGLDGAASPLDVLSAEARGAIAGWARLAGATGDAAAASGSATPFTLKQAALAGLR